MDAIEQVSAVCTECGAPLRFPLGAGQVRCGHCDAGMAVGEGLGLVRLDCPACGGNFYYISGSMAGRCPYCEVPLLALTRNRVLRFVVRPRADRPAEAGEARLVLLPFWRLVGLLFGWDVGSRVELVQGAPGSYQEASSEPSPRTTRRDSGPLKLFRSRVVDRHVADPAAEAFGVTSLRLRPAVHPVEPFEAEHEQLGLVVPTTLEVPGARDALLSAAMTLGCAADGITSLECQRADLVADSISVLYYPFWVARRDGGLVAWDAVSGQPEPLGPERTAPELSGSTAFDELKVVEARCRSCGEPLAIGNHATVYPCPSCRTFWAADREGLAPFEASFARPLVEAGEAEAVWLPFWRVRAEVDHGGSSARQVRDLKAVLGVHGPAGEGVSAPPEDPLRYFVPAYGALRAPRLDYAARDMTRLQPLLEAGPAGAGETFNCFLGPEDAERLAYVVMLQVVAGSVPRRVASLRVRPAEVDLWYVPFADEGRELRNLLTGLRYDRSTFRGVGH